MVEELRSAGWSDRRIQGIIRFQIKARIKQYYEDKKIPVKLGDLDIESLRKRDSKAEMVFYEMMIAAGIKFRFQYKIGPYRADYLIGDNLVVELDGPQHRKQNSVDHDLKRDKYLISRGYNVLRLDLDMVILDPKAAVEGIEEFV